MQVHVLTSIQNL